MNRMAKRILGKGGWSILLVLMVGFIFSSLAQAQSADSPMLRLGYKHADLQTLDPHRAAGSQDRVLVAMIFNGLLRYQPGNQSVDTIEPDLAKNIPVPQILPDGRQQWVFHLRQGVMSHPYEGKPGYEITSEDVVYSLGRAADQKRSTYSGDFAGMTFEATNKYAVSVIVAKPISPHLFLPKFANMSGGLIVCKKPVEEKGDKWCKTNPVGTGPFMFKSYHPMQKVVLVRNPQYFLGPSKLAAIEFFYMPNVSSREMALQKGEVDVIEGPREQSWLKKVEKIPGVIIDATKGSENIVAHFNMSVKPLHLLKVRQAMAYALDRKEFVAVYGPMISDPLYSPIPVKQMASGLTKEEIAEKNFLYEFDPARAKKLLAEAGYPKGFSLEVFTSQSDTYKRAYELMQAQLRKVGIHLKLSVVDHATYHARIRQNLNPIAVYSTGFRPNADVILTQFFHSASVVVTGKKPNANFSHFGAVDADGDGAIDSIDTFIEKAQLEKDPRKQVELWKEAQRKILHYMVAFPIIDLGYLFARQPYVDWGYKMITIVDGPKATEKTQIVKK